MNKFFSTGYTAALLLFALGAVTAITSCKHTSSGGYAKQKFEIKLVYPPETAQFLEQLAEKFKNSSPSLPDGTKIELSLIKSPSLKAADSIASGKVKTHAWLASSTSLVNYVNSNLKNLGPRQTDCEQLFATPMVLAAARSRLGDFKAREQTLSWEKAVIDKLNVGAHSAINPNSMHFNHASPGVSPTGYSALIQLAYMMLGQNSSVSLKALKSPRNFGRLKALESAISSYGFSEQVLLKNVATAKGNKVHFSLTTEREVSLFNKNSAISSPSIVALYPSEGSYWMDYVICLSDADWVTPAHKAAVRVFVHFLSTEEAQKEALSEGFRPSRLKLAAEPPLTRQFGVDVTNGKKALLPVSGEVFNYLKDKWPELRRPGVILLILDTSGSMEGAKLRLGKRFFREILAVSSWKDLKGLITFSTEPSLVSDFTLDSGEIIPKIDRLTSIGGSAVYDGLKKGIDTLLRSNLNGYRKTIVLYTDGSDKNSHVPLSSLASLLEDFSKRYNVNLFIVGVGRETDFSDLRRLASAANGAFFEGGLDDMEAVFDEIKANL